MQSLKRVGKVSISTSFLKNRFLIYIALCSPIEARKRKYILPDPLPVFVNGLYLIFLKFFMTFDISLLGPASFILIFLQIQKEFVKGKKWERVFFTK